MSPVADTLRRLRVAGAGCAVLLVVAGALASHAAERAATAERQQVQRQRERVDALRQVEALRADVERLEAFVARHAALRDAGALGAFERTREVDRFERLARDGGDASIARYTLRPPVSLPAAQAGLARHALRMQPLTFEASVPHEEAFVALWRRLADGLGGLAALEGCDLALSEAAGGVHAQGGADAAAAPVSSAGVASSAVAGSATPTGDGRASPSDRRVVAVPTWPRLKATCTLAWYAIEPRAAAAPALAGAPPLLPGGRP